MGRGEARRWRGREMERELVSSIREKRRGEEGRRGEGNVPSNRIPSKIINLKKTASS